jgi:hypothetical protein
MANQNVTLALPQATLVQARKIAVERRTSLSRLLIGLIEELVSADERYRRARERHLAILEAGFEMGTEGKPPATRDELHER